MTVIEKYLQDVTREIDNINKLNCDSKNSAPCVKCGNNDFIVLYRNVVGEIEGDMYGSWSLLGGSMSGTINGETKTLPLLSCSNCKQERLIETWEYTFEDDQFWDDMFSFYFGVDYKEPKRFKDINDVYLANPLETRKYMLDNPNCDDEYYDEMPEWSTSIWAESGFKIAKKEHKVLWWTESYYPSWDDLKKESK